MNFSCNLSCGPLGNLAQIDVLLKTQRLHSAIHVWFICINVCMCLLTLVLVSMKGLDLPQHHAKNDQIFAAPADEPNNRHTNLKNNSRLTICCCTSVLMGSALRSLILSRDVERTLESLEFVSVEGMCKSCKKKSSSDMCIGTLCEGKNVEGRRFFTRVLCRQILKAVAV
ncbi:hypothetical protein FF38_03346 [Lucilia cuprina]|uniref:Uncharacterized protein n=1 Tax=Lucilia cuprina TaxID=7375 RepID=A0A0L0C3H2_LUCCU|nr:hypothetical protein FF38_03346 [Lucilia cuprina]